LFLWIGRTVTQFKMAYGLRAFASAGVLPVETTTITTDPVGDKVERTTVVAEPNGDTVEKTQVSNVAGDAETTRLRSFYGGEVKETRLRDALTGRTSVSRIRSESPRGRLYDPLWTRAGYWGPQLLAAPTARPPLALEPGKLGDSLATSLHVEARNKQLDDPLDARSLYPLTGPLMRRSYLMDDLPTPADHPVYRSADADTSPWCRRAAYLDDPTYKHSAYRGAGTDPLYRGSSDFYGARQLTDPLYRGDLYDPLYRGALTDPLYRGGLADPLYRGSLADPLYRGSLADPLYRGALADPLYRGSLADPLYRGRADALYRGALVDPLCRRSAVRALSPRALSPRSRRFL